MQMIKRISLFLLLNILVCTAVSFVLMLLNVQPFLTRYGLDIGSLATLCFIWGMMGALISLALSRLMAKWMLGVRLIHADTQDPEERAVWDMVASLSREARLPMPEVGIFRSNEANAFATGPSQRRSLIAVSTGLLQRMNASQVRGVLAHELTHIANGDMVTMTLLQGVVNAFVMFLARVLAYALSGLGRNRNHNQGSMASFYLFTQVFQIIFMILGSLLVASFSRWREYRADAGGARLAGKDSMISALRALANLEDIRDIKMEEKAAFQALGIASRKNKWVSLFATHPPLEKRIERLEQLS